MEIKSIPHPRKAMSERAALTGYDTHDRYYATRYDQGGRTVYSIDLSLQSVAATLPRPDPAHPTPGNRRVKESHARSFGQYVRDNKEWVSPALLLRSPDMFEFEVRDQITGTQFGILGIPRLARTDLRILDGQHRILGLHYAVEDIANEIEKARSLLAIAKRDENRELEHQHQVTIRKLQEQRDRLSRERISVQVHLEDDLKKYEQMFVDIADNALGITSAIRARFDTRKVVNRALEDVLKHALLVGRVDMEQDRVGGGSPNLLGAKHVADIVRTVAVGIGGRVGRRQEGELREAELVEKANGFLDVLLGAFPDFEKLANGDVTSEDLRKSSLLGSTTMLRVLAGAYYELAKDMSDDDIRDFFARLAPHMSAPVEDASPWMDTGVFREGAMAPNARRQDLETLANAIVSWAKMVPGWLEEV
jgi:hypothetical protein